MGGAGPDSFNTPVIVLSGPTASGKSALAVALCEALATEVVNIDSAQFFRGMDIGTAKPDSSLTGRVRHHLYQEFEPTRQVDAKIVCDKVVEKASELRQQGKAAVLVGSPGMYISALCAGLSELPSTNLEVRCALEKLSNEELWSRLLAVDALRAQALHSNDRQRVLRALEVFEMTGRPQSELFSVNPPHARLNALMIILVPDRASLYHRIERRTEAMVKNGVIEETRHLISRYGKTAVLRKTIGYKEALAVLENQLSIEEWKVTVAQQTRRYAKRQFTFWRNEPLKRGWLSKCSVKILPEEYEVVEILRLLTSYVSHCFPEQYKKADVQMASTEQLKQLIQVALKRVETEKRSQVWYLVECAR